MNHRGAPASRLWTGRRMRCDIVHAQAATAALFFAQPLHRKAGWVYGDRPHVDAGTGVCVYACAMSARSEVAPTHSLVAADGSSLRVRWLLFSCYRTAECERILAQREASAPRRGGLLAVGCANRSHCAHVVTASSQCQRQRDRRIGTWLSGAAQMPTPPWGLERALDVAPRCACMPGQHEGEASRLLAAPPALLLHIERPARSGPHPSQAVPCH